MKYLAYLILAFAIGFNLYLNFPETKILADPNDNIFQYSLVYRTNWVWENYGCPLSLSCLPNLTDHAVTAWAEGYPLPFYYSHIPQIVIVASYNLVVNPLITQLLNYPITLYQYYNLTKYLLLCFFPLPVFFALRLVGFSFLTSALGAFFSSHFSTDGLYGIDPPSYLWRGYGLTSQLYAVLFLPLGLAFTYKALSLTGSHKGTPGVARKDSPGVEELGNPQLSRSSTSGEPFGHPRGVLTASFIKQLKYSTSRYSILAILFLTLTTASHLGIGIIGILSTIPMLFLDIKPKNIWERIKKLFIIHGALILTLSYWIIPMVLNNNYHIISFWDPIWKFNSYGWHEVARQFLQGEIFDWQRAPIITGLVTIGFFTLATNSRLFPFSLLFIFWFLLYFGRTTWGGLIDFIPGMKDFHQHRFIVGVHIAALFLIPAGIDYILRFLQRISHFEILAVKSKVKLALNHLWGGRLNPDLIGRSHDSPEVKGRKTISSPLGSPFGHPRGVLVSLLSFQNIIFSPLSLTFISILAYFTIKQTIAYAQLNNRWIGEANNAYRYDEKNFQDLATFLQTLPSARIYAGRPGNWGKEFRLGSTQMYMLFGISGFDISQFLPETWSPLSENEQNFDERVAEDYDLLNISYIVAPKNQGFSQTAKIAKKFGPFELYQVETSGWFDVVSSPMFVKTDKTNFINLVHYWHRSYPRRWKMHPLISVEKKPEIPAGMQKILTMRDEVNYSEEGKEGLTPIKTQTKNIFSDFPFVFPEATTSAFLKEDAQDTPGVAPTSSAVAFTTSGEGRRDSPGVEDLKNTAIISNEKVNKQTYSATIEVPNNCKQCMIMFKMSYHPNWLAKLDGKPTAKYAVFPFYLATSASPGTHDIEFTYQPNKLKVVLLAGELLIVILFLLKKRGKLFFYLKRIRKNLRGRGKLGGVG